jgi:uncharacterized protein (TIGR02452 family)
VSVSRTRAAAIAADALRIIHAGRYTNLRDEVIDIAGDLRRAVAGTRSFPPAAALPHFAPAGTPTAFEVLNETTLAAAERLARGGLRPVALNFASAKHPGGGFLGGARAQEESLCRSSGLYACLNGNPMYEFHERAGGGFYTNYAIYSPDVPVFFTDAGNPLPEPYRCSFVTSPAVNAGVYLGRSPDRGEEVREEMSQRIDKVLTIAAGHGHDTAVLGAWGCGVFRNDPEEIAELFRVAFDGPFRGVFARVVFAVLDNSADRSTFGAFERPFRGGQSDTALNARDDLV